MTTPILYSFRRCPYAMRARLALVSAGVCVVLREVVLRDKPAAFLEASPSATVPCLMTTEGTIDESLDIMVWALQQNDPEHLLVMPAEGWDWITRCDGPFKQALDRTKYANRHPGTDPLSEREKAGRFLADIDAQLQGREHLFGAMTVADIAILPFVRQFAFIDKDWFDAQGWPAVQRWLAAFMASRNFEVIMTKLPQWNAGDDETRFPMP